MRELAGLFAIEVCGYFMLPDWTGRELRADKCGAIPDHLAPIMERLGVNRSNGVETARLRSTVQAGGGAIELAGQCRSAPFTVSDAVNSHCGDTKDGRRRANDCDGHRMQ